MTPAADCRHCQEAMDESHYLTNIVPQDFNNNSGCDLQSGDSVEIPHQLNHPIIHYTLIDE